MRYRAYLSALRQPPLPLLCLTALLAWIMLFHIHVHELHSLSPVLFSVSDERTSIIAAAWLSITSLTSWGWIAMLIAMMLPLLASPLRYVWQVNFPCKRISGIFTFLVGYVTIWTVVYSLLASLIYLLTQFINYNLTVLLCIGLLITLIWQSSPWKQMCLNRCHDLPRINPFGLRAEHDCFIYGLQKGSWCIGSCWALMCLPIFAPRSAMQLMPLVSLMMFVEQAYPWQKERWQFPYRWLLFR